MIWYQSILSFRLNTSLYWWWSLVISNKTKNLKKKFSFKMQGNSSIRLKKSSTDKTVKLLLNFCSNVPPFSTKKTLKKLKERDNNLCDLIEIHRMFPHWKFLSLSCCIFIKNVKETSDCYQCNFLLQKVKFPKKEKLFLNSTSFLRR